MAESEFRKGKIITISLHFYFKQKKKKDIILFASYNTLSMIYKHRSISIIW